MSKGNKILVILLIAAMSVGCGFAGGYLSQKFYNEKNIEPKNIEQIDKNKDLTDIGDASKLVVKDEGTDAREPAGLTNSDILNPNLLLEYGPTVAELIYEKVVPSVVSVTTRYESEMSAYDWFFGGGRYGTQESSCVGTGFIVNSNGYILTNSHVVNDGNYKSINIGVYDGTDYEGKVLWNDATLDLAIVKIEASGLTSAELGDSDKMKYGSYAAVIGNPLGLTFERSISQGIISGLDRTITVGSTSGFSYTVMEGLMQTDAAINSGNSGGPLLNSAGQVVAIASAKASSGESMGFAIPINIAKPIIEQIIETGSYQRVYLGISAVGIDSQTSMSEAAKIQRYGYKTGIYVAEITEGGGAQAAGLKVGDVIIKVNGTAVGSMNRLYTVLVGCKSGDSVSVTYIRGGEESTVSVIVK